MRNLYILLPVFQSKGLNGSGEFFPSWRQGRI